MYNTNTECSFTQHTRKQIQNAKHKYRNIAGQSAEGGGGVLKRASVLKLWELQDKDNISQGGHGGGKIKKPSIQTFAAFGICFSRIQNDDHYDSDGDDKDGENDDDDDDKDVDNNDSA